MRQRLLLSLIGILVLAYGGFIAILATGTRPALGLDLQGGISVTQEPKDDNPNSAALDLAVERIRDRVDSLGVAEPEILRQGNTIVVNLPGVKNQQQAVDLVQVTGQVYLRPVVSQCQFLQTDPTKTSSIQFSLAANEVLDATTVTAADFSVSDGTITSSTYPRPAATYGLANLSSYSVIRRARSASLSCASAISLRYRMFTAP